MVNWGSSYSIIAFWRVVPSLHHSTVISGDTKMAAIGFNLVKCTWTGMITWSLALMPIWRRIREGSVPVDFQRSISIVFVITIGHCATKKNKKGLALVLKLASNWLWRWRPKSLGYRSSLHKEFPGEIMHTLPAIQLSFRSLILSNYRGWIMKE